MTKSLLDQAGPHGLLAICYLVAAAAFILWLFLPINDGWGSRIATACGWASTVIVLGITLGLLNFDRLLEHGVPGFDVLVLVCLFLLVNVGLVPLAAFILFGRLIGRIVARFIRGY
ncbi:hypothetical protein [Mesorhizobium sp.]|uniref:hypothetical protein n=1 Tax=Mesorhizobium sp. TaxID=1871066 RepID=UPI000FE95380|nr:hypothetical protein [Mesorhizobium sp.]RWB22145.1 MAG: hypothetical protein EOQ40_07525 [Mesorhizobium sp.]TIS47325.1 MAG: hypothetical protein E5W96_22285 [Mesorhizobium sp.]